MEIINLENVSKIYQVGDHVLKALDEINLSLNAGDLIVILGPSGAGKSTILNLLGGLDTPTNGNIIIDRLIHHSTIVKITGKSYRIKDKLIDIDQQTKNFEPLNP